MNKEAVVHARLIELETKLAFQEQTIETLNAVVTQLQATADRLTHEVGVLKTQLRTAAPSLVGDRIDEKPPHY